MSWLDTLGRMSSGVQGFMGIDDAWHDLTMAFTDGGEDDSVFGDIGQALGAVGQYATAPIVGTFRAMEAGAHYATSGVGYLNSLSHYGDGPVQFAGRSLFGGFGVAGAAFSSLQGVDQDWSKSGESFDSYRNRAFNSTLGGGWDNGLSMGETQIAGLIGAASVNRAAGLQSTNPLEWTAEQRDQAFRGDGAPLKWATGTTDLVYGTLIDPSNLLPGVGKAARLASAGKYITPADPKGLRGAFRMSQSAVEEMFAAATPDSGIGKYMQFVADSDYATLVKSPIAKRSGNADLYASLGAKAKTVEEVADVHTILMRTGDEAALRAARDRLVAAEAARGGVPQETDWIVDNVLNGKPGLELADPDGLVNDTRLGHILTSFLTDPESSLSRAYAAKLDKTITNPTPVINRAPGTNAFLRHNERVATRRSNKAGLKGTATVTVEQPTSAHPVMAVVRWPTDNHVTNYFTRPRSSGILNLHDADSGNEVAALIDDIDRETGGAMQGGLGRSLLNLYGEAETEFDRMRVALMIEQKGLELVGAKYGMSGTEAKQLWAIAHEKRSKALAEHRDNGYVSWLLESGDTAVAKVPDLEREAANMLPLIDFAEVNRGIRRHNANGLRGALSDLGKSTVGAMDVINDIFKISVLLRLGYTIRNTTEAYASLAVSGYLGSILLSAGQDSAESFVAHRVAQKNRILDRMGVRRGTLRDIPVLQSDNHSSAAAVRFHEGVLEGVREAALRRASVNVTPEQIDLLSRYRNATDTLTNAEMAQAEELQGLLRQIAELRGETTRTTTYHATDRPTFDTIDGDWIDTTPSMGVASAMSDRVNTLMSWETASNGINLNMAVKRTKDADGNWVTTPARTRLEAGYHTLLDQAKEALDAGMVVETRTPTGWRPVTAEQVDDLRTRTYRRGMERTVLRTREAGRKPGVVEVPSYGEELDLTNLAKWPEDLKAALGITHSAPRHTAQRRRNRPSFKEWVEREAWNEDEVAQALASYARDNGYGRIVLPSKQWGQTVRVLKDYADDFGGRGAKAVVDRRLDEVMRETIETGNASALPPSSYISDNRLARRRNRQNENLARSPRARLNGRPLRPVAPGYEAEHIETIMAQGIIPAMKQATENLVRSKAWHEATSTALADGIRRQERMTVRASQRLGTKDLVVMTANGPHRIPGAFSGASGEINWMRTHGDANYEALTGDGTQIFSQAIGQAIPTRVRPDEPRYFEAWANMLNWHWRDPSSGRLDPLVEKLLDGQTPDELTAWMRSGDGLRYRDNFGWDEEQSAAAAQRLQQAISLYLPDEITQDLWRAGNLDAAVLSDRYGGRTDLKELNGLLVPQSREYADQMSVGELVNLGARKMFHFLGALPETAWARHPMYRAYYKREMERLVPEAVARKGETLTLDEINTIAATVRERGRQEVGQTLFTITRRTGASQQLRLIAPFYAAWENVLQRWGRFAVKDTERIMVGGHYIQRAFESANLVNSETGEPVKLGEVGIDQTAMILPWKIQGWDARVPVASLDVVFQGNPLNPGIGPFVAAPLVQVMKSQPRAEQVLEWAFPAGIPKDTLDVFLSGAGRRLKSAAFQDQSFINDANRIAQMEYIRYQRGERTDLPEWPEIEDKARKFYGLRFITNLTAPFAMQYTNDVNYYSEELRRYKASYGDDEGELRFLEDRPEAFVVMQSLSNNRSGARATYESVDNLKAYNSLTAQAEASGDDQMLGWLANYGQGDYNPDNFSEAAYNWQLANSPVAGAAAYRSRKNPAQIWADAQVYKGWVEFRGVMDGIEAELLRSGIDVTDPGVQSALSDVRGAMADDIGADNEHWMLDWKTTDRAKFDRRTMFFESVLEDEAFMADHADDPLMRGIASFLDLRSQMQSELQFRDAQGGAKTLKAQDNADLLTAWNTRIMQMKQESIGFADWYDRYYSNDPVVI